MRQIKGYIIKLELSVLDLKTVEVENLQSIQEYQLFQNGLKILWSLRNKLLETGAKKIGLGLSQQ